MTVRRGSFVLPVTLLALLGALIGFLAATMASSKPLFREAAGQELAPWVSARAYTPQIATDLPVPVTAPLYPRLITLLGSLEEGPAAARRAQMVLLGFLLPLLAGLAGRRHFGRRSGIGAALLTLLLGGVWIQVSWLIPFGWQAALALAILALWPRHGDVGPVTALVAGLLIGLTRLLGAAWAPLWVLFLVAGLALRRRWAPALALVVAAVLVMSLPAVIRMTPIPLATPVVLGGGLDAEAGLHDGASGVDPRRGEKGAWRWMTPGDLALEQERAAGHRLDPAALSRRAWAQALGWLVHHPIEGIGLLLKKSWLMASGVEMAAPDSLRFRAGQLIPWAGPLLWLSPLVVALGLAGLVFVRRGVRDPAGIHAHGLSGRGVTGALLLATLTSAAFSVVRTGDRLALLLVLTGPAAAAVAQWLRRPTGGGAPAEPRPAPAGPLLALAGLLLVLTLLPAFFVTPKFESEAEDRFQLGTALDRMKRPAEAQAEYDRALRRDPRHVAARLARVASQARDGLYDVATREAEDVAGQYPRVYVVWNLLSRLYQQQQRFAESASAYERLLELDPFNAEGWNNLGTIYASLGRYEPAVTALRKALAIDPNYRNAFVNLSEIEKRGPEGLSGARPVLGAPGGAGSGLQAGVTAVMQQLQAGQIEAAERTLAEIRQKYGAGPDIDMAAGTVALYKADFATAIQLYERVRPTRPADPGLLNNLAAAYAQSGQAARAIPLWEEVLRQDPDNAGVQANLDRARKAVSGAPPAP